VAHVIIKLHRDLTRHNQSVHAGKKYPCGTCEYHATARGNLTKHQQSVHVGKYILGAHVTIRQLREES
jgi:hypothetical protein